MLFIERKPVPNLRRFVRRLWYASGPAVEHRRERLLPSGCAHIVLSLSRNYLTECIEDRPDQRTASALMVGQRSHYELVTTADFVETAGVLFVPSAVPALIADRADLITNQNLPLDQVWSGYTDYLRSRMLESFAPEARLRILEDCMMGLLKLQSTSRDWGPHPAVRFALGQFDRNPGRLSIAELARHSGWSERRFSQVFREQVGFTPKVWQRLKRFQHAVRQLQVGPGVPWAEMAAECGFYDQAHFANEFRAFAGVDLTAYTKSLHPSGASHPHAQ